MGNQALSINPPGDSITFSLTTEGSDWLWTVFCIMSLSTIIVTILLMRRHKEERTLHLFNLCILLTSSVAYFCMASDLGFAAVQVVQNGPGTRQVWYVRYIDWVITTPLILAQLFLTAGLPMNTILTGIFADAVMIICGLIGALVPSVYKWAFYVFAIVIMFAIFYLIIYGVRLSKENDEPKIYRNNIILAAWIIFFWSLYPISWGLSEGSNTIWVTGEMIFYGVLDIFTKPIFAALILFLHRHIDDEKKNVSTIV